MNGERTKDTTTNLEMADAHKDLTDIIPRKGCSFTPQQTHKVSLRENFFPIFPSHFTYYENFPENP